MMREKFKHYAWNKTLFIKRENLCNKRMHPQTTLPLHVRPEKIK